MGQSNRRSNGKPVPNQSKLTPEVHKRIVKAVRDGNTNETSALAAGISKSCFQRWLARGEKARSGIYHDFYHAVTQARAQAEIRDVGVIKRAGRDRWREKVVTRTYPKTTWVPSDDGKTMVAQTVMITETTTTREPIIGDWRASFARLERAERQTWGKSHQDADGGALPPPSGTPRELAQEILDAINAIDSVTDRVDDQPATDA